MITVLLPALLADPRSPLLPCVQTVTSEDQGHGKAALSKQWRRSAPRNLLRLRCAYHPSNTHCCLRPFCAAHSPGNLDATSHVFWLPMRVAGRSLADFRRRAGKGRGHGPVRAVSELGETLHEEPRRGLLRGGAAVGVPSHIAHQDADTRKGKRAARPRAQACGLPGGLGGAEGWAVGLGRGWPGARRAGRAAAVARRPWRAGPGSAAGAQV